MAQDLQNFDPKAPKKTASRKLLQMVVFGALLVCSLVGLPMVHFSMANSTGKYFLMAALAANGIAAMVNLYRTFRPHKN